MEFILIPPDSLAKPANLTFGSVNVVLFQAEYEDEISRILQVHLRFAIAYNDLDKIVALAVNECGGTVSENDFNTRKDVRTAENRLNFIYG